MPRISGVNIPEEKRVEVALTYIYGVGHTNVKEILRVAQVDPDKRAKNLTDQEVANIVRALESVPVEGALRKMVNDNIQRLKQIRTYRGLRHIMRLPTKGQRTRVNARTRRGRRMTIGAMTKEMAQKLEAAKK
jgi:small subunit ribosomal protein S13